jgi:WD40 repeat protein
MDTIDKIHFAFCAYDFDNAGSLSFDEATLLLRSVVQGLGKVSPSNVIFTSPTPAEVERFTGLVFQYANKEGGSKSQSRVNTAEFRSYCSAHPVTSSWLKTVAQFPAESAAGNTLSAELGDPAVVLGPAASQVYTQARHPHQSASIISEEDYLIIAATKAQEAAEAAKPKNTDILGGGGEGDGEDEDEESQEARRAAQAAALAAAAASDPDAPVLPPWASAVELLRPEDAPTEARNDPPEDLFEPVWMTGVNIARTGEAGAVAAPYMHRCVKYANMTLPPVPEAAPEGEEVAPVVPPTVVLGSAAAQVFVMRKEEEAGWNQRLHTQHTGAVTCLDVHYARNLLVTAESTPAAAGGSRVVLWALDTLAVQTTIATKHGVKFLDLSENGAHLLVVTDDLASTVTMYEIPSGRAVYARPLLLGPRTVKDCITDVRFTGTTAMFAVGSAMQGVTFYVEEGGSFMGENGLKLYEERSGLYQAVGRPAVGAAVTELCRFEGADELVAGTDKGQLLVWHGRTVAQLIEAHRTAVRALDFNRNTLTLVSGGEDGVINIYQLAAHTSAAAARGKRTPQIVAPRLLELSATFDILRHDLCSYAVRSLCLSADSRRALVTTAACEVMELALFITPPTADEIAEAEALAEAENTARAEAQAAAAAAREAAIAAGEAPTEGEQPEEVPFVSAVPSLQRFLGDDVHKGPILTAHFPTTVGAAAVVTGVCRVPGGGFASCGTDGTVRLWQGAGGSEETGAAVYKTTKVVKMDSGCSAVDASAALIAVALAGEPNNDRVGSIHLFSLPDMQFVTQFSEPTQAVTTLKFSPEGNTLVAASRDGVLYVYQATEGQWAHKGVCGANTVQVDAFATKLDFSADGLYVRCFFPQTQVYRLFDVTSPAFGRDLTDLTAVPPPPAKKQPVEGEEEAPAEEPAPSGPPLEVMRSLAWASNSCAYNWDTKGALSHLLPGATDRFNHLLLTATGSGAVAVERVPQLKYAAKKQQLDPSKLVTFSAHLGGVSALVFIEEGARLVTAGAQDGTLRVWKVLYDMDEFEPDPVI